MLTREGLKGPKRAEKAPGAVLTSEARRAERDDSSLRYILGRHPDPLLVELLIGAVVLDLGQSPVDGVD